jgi:hypothetical protein
MLQAAKCGVASVSLLTLHKLTQETGSILWGRRPVVAATKHHEGKTGPG